MMAGSPAWKPHAMFAAVTSVEQCLVVSDRPAAVPLADVGRERYLRHFQHPHTLGGPRVQG